MAELTQTLHEEHAQLAVEVERIKQAARGMSVLTEDERRQVLAPVLAFLRGTLVPHAKTEERELYPKVGRILGHPDATAAMVYDHLAIRERIVELEEAPVEDLARLQELLYGLYALIRSHFRKEEELYLPLLETGPGSAAYDEPVLRHEP